MRTRLLGSSLLALSSLFLAAVLSACSGASSGNATGATCDSSLTYANFGQAFFQSNCLSCHNGREKPTLSTVAAIRSNKSAIDMQAGSGPNGTNTAMPEGNDIGVDQRKKLSAWLACGAPE